MWPGCVLSETCARLLEGVGLAKKHRSVRVDEQLLAELEELARQRAVPVTFAEQVDAALRLLAQHAAEQRLRRSAGLVRADRNRADETFRRLRRRDRR
jgi:hypothetical protein